MNNYIKGSTVKGQRIVSMFGRWDGYYLDEVYGRYSKAKADAWEECLAWCEADGGKEFHIGSHNCTTFTCAWTYTDKETGHRIIRVETAKNSYKVDTEV